MSNRCKSFVYSEIGISDTRMDGRMDGRNVNGWDSHSVKSFVCNGLALADGS